jgi:hypothetical protein
MKETKEIDLFLSSSYSSRPSWFRSGVSGERGAGRRANAPNKPNYPKRGTEAVSAVVPVESAHYSSIPAFQSSGVGPSIPMFHYSSPTHIVRNEPNSQPHGTGGDCAKRTQLPEAGHCGGVREQTGRARGPMAQTKPICCRQDRSRQTKPISVRPELELNPLQKESYAVCVRFTESAKQSQFGRSRARACPFGRLRASSELAEGTPNPRGDDYAKRSQTWAGWGI